MPTALADTVQTGDPQQSDGVSIVPLFPRRSPVCDYVALDRAMEAGLRIAEVDEAGDVGRLRLANPTDCRVLVYDGQEIVGAKQNRIPDVSVLVEAGTAIDIPVSCVEQGRWRRVSAHFAAASHATGPRLRRAKAEGLASRPAGYGAAQGVVWASVAADERRHGSSSPTRAQSDLFAHRAAAMRSLLGGFPLQPGQVGAVLCLGAAPVCIDLVSRPDAWARLHERILRGYLLDALGEPEAGEPPPGAAEAFVAAVAGARVERVPGVGLGENLRIAGDGVIGSGLALGDETIQLSAYAAGATRPGGLR
jgi:hypothetical protein